MMIMGETGKVEDLERSLMEATKSDKARQACSSQGSVWPSSGATAVDQHIGEDNLCLLWVSHALRLLGLPAVSIDPVAACGSMTIDHCLKARREAWDWPEAEADGNHVREGRVELP